MVQMIKIVVVLITIHFNAGQEDHVWCYECGTGVVGEPDCLVFALASSWRPFWRKCPADSVCVKTMPGWDMSDELHAVRGCTPKVSLAGTVHQDGCWSYATSSTITCYCTSNLCNYAPLRATIPIPLILVCTVLLIITYYT